MSDTPRTDAIATAIGKSGTDWHHSATLMRNYANGLELELAQVRAYNTELYEKTDHHAIARELADWKARYKSLDGVRCNLDIKLTVALADAAQLRAVLAELSETAGLREWSTAANAAFLAALNKGRQMLQP